MDFLTRASLYLSDHTDAELVAMWALPRADRLHPIPLADLQALLLREGLQEALETSATDPAVDPQVQTLLKRFLALLSATRLMNLSYDQDDVRAATLAVIASMTALNRMTADQAASIKALGGGDPYTWAEADGLGTAEAHFAAARLAKARRDAVAAAQPALDAWLAAEAAKVTAWAAGGFSGDLAAMGTFTYPTGGGQ